VVKATHRLKILQWPLAWLYLGNPWNTGPPQTSAGLGLGANPHLQRKHKSFKWALWPCAVLLTSLLSLSRCQVLSVPLDKLLSQE
jgi:hypothetical protein